MLLFPVLKSLYQLGANGNSSLEVCESMEDNICMFDVFMEIFQEATPECHTNCISTEYNSLISSIHTFNDSAPIITVGFASTVATINEEYLIYDFSGMVGSLGGNLGLFVGFSFRDFFLFIIEMFL